MLCLFTLFSKLYSLHPNIYYRARFFCKATEPFPRNCAAEMEPGKEEARIKQVHKNLE
jgi:hypothetical protein